MLVSGHGVISCLCVFFGVWREHKKKKESNIHECILELIASA